MWPHGPWLHFPSGPPKILSFLSFKFPNLIPHKFKADASTLKEVAQALLLKRISQSGSIYPCLLKPATMVFQREAWGGAFNQATPSGWVLFQSTVDIGCFPMMSPAEQPLPFTQPKKKMSLAFTRKAFSESFLWATERWSGGPNQGGVFFSMNSTSFRETHLLSTYLHDGMTEAKQGHGTHSECVAQIHEWTASVQSPGNRQSSVQDINSPQSPQKSVSQNKWPFQSESTHSESN